MNWTGWWLWWLNTTCYHKRQCQSFKVTVLLLYWVFLDIIVSNTLHAVMVYYYHNGWFEDYPKWVIGVAPPTVQFQSICHPYVTVTCLMKFSFCHLARLSHSHTWDLGTICAHDRFKQISLWGSCLHKHLPNKEFCFESVTCTDCAKSQVSVKMEIQVSVKCT